MIFNGLVSAIGGDVADFLKSELMRVIESTGTAGPFVVMGVSGCGKSTIAALLASRAGGVFLDADDFHPLENKAKMAASIPLTDEDRWPWLDALNLELKARTAGGQLVFLACSALREAYRNRLCLGLRGLRFIYLKGTRELILGRIQGREGHFMPPALLASQFAILEEPADAMVVPIEMPVDEMLGDILTGLRLPEVGGQTAATAT